LCDHNTEDASCCCEGNLGDSLARGRAICHHGGNIPRHFILPATLLLLDEEPTHGYSLFRKLSELGVIDSEMSPATVYRVLSKLEHEGLAVHKHVDGGQGPTRKVYSLTDEGRSALTAWASRIEKTKGFLDWFIERLP